MDNNNKMATRKQQQLYTTYIPPCTCIDMHVCMYVRLYECKIFQHFLYVILSQYCMDMHTNPIQYNSNSN